MTTSSSGSQLARLPDTCGSDDAGTVREMRLTVQDALPAVSRLQRAALGIYGCLEPDRALAWTLEELGELAQAVRRSEGRARLEEELGQLTAWTLCLANILGVDLAAALRSAVDEEIDRQVGKYGKLTPYQAGR